MALSGERIRQLVLEAVRPHCGSPLFFSGGVDSSTLLAAMLALGDEPRCYTFTFGTKESEDVLVARAICRHFGLRQTVVHVPSGLEAVERDVREAVRLIGRKPLKTHVQCGIPFMHLARAARSDGFSKAVSGITADDILGTSKNAVIARAKGGEKAYAEHRRKDAENPNNSFFSCARIASACGIEVAAPYKNEALREAVLGMTFDELHKPRKKSALLKAFPEFWAQGSWYRPNKNLQIVSGLRDYHDRLLQSPLNRRSHKSVAGIYSDIYEGRV